MSLNDLFGHRSKRANAWHVESIWLSTVLSPPEKDELVLRHDEVSLRIISRTQGQVVIAISDEQAGAITGHHARDAFPPH